MHPSAGLGGFEMGGTDLNEAKLKDDLNQLPLPWRKKVHTFDPEFFKCDQKIVKYNSSQLADWRAVVSFSHTILSDSTTWRHLSFLTILCFLTTGIVYASGSYRSVMDDNAVTARIQTLISFVFASYVTIVLNRWDRVRNTTLGQMWGSLENINFITFKSIHRRNKLRLKDKTLSTNDKALIAAEQNSIAAQIIRYSRLTMILTFLAAQGNDDFNLLYEHNLVTPEEEGWLKAAMIGTRPLLVVSWISELLDDVLPEQGYDLSESTQNTVLQNVLSLRGGIGGTLGCIGSQLPYPYVHILYWTIQILLSSLAIETGVNLATYYYFSKNGMGQYSPPGDDQTWPNNPNVWYLNTFLQVTASNVIYALFIEGLLNVCDKLSNPLSQHETSFSERLFDTFIHNNCRAMYAGITGLQLKLDGAAVESVPSKDEPSEATKAPMK